MRIAFFIDDYLPSVHGVATSVVNYKRALEDLGHEVYVVAPKVKGYEDNDDHIIRMPSSKKVLFDKRIIARIYPGLARKLDKYKFDIVHSQTQFHLGVLASYVAKRQNIPHVTTIHTLFTELIDDYPFMIIAGIILLTLATPVVLHTKPILPTVSRQQLLGIDKAKIKNMLSRQGWRLIAAFANKCDACVSPSKHLAEILIEKGGLETPYRIFPNAIETRRYRQFKAQDSPIAKQAGDKFIICVARLSPEKRQDILVKALAKISDPSIKLVLVGGGVTEAKLKKTISELGLEKRVFLTGMCDAAQVGALLKQADVFALASYHFDNQPMSFLEAAASGLPIVYCDERMTEALTKDNAVLTDGIDAAAFAKTFKKLLADPERMNSLSKGALRVAQEYDSITMAKKMLCLYQELIDTKQRQSVAK